MNKGKILDVCQFTTYLFYKINEEWKVVVRERYKENFLTLIWEENTFGADPNIF